MKKYFILITLLLANSLAYATPQRFDFTFAENPGSATATGFIIFESDLLPNPGSDFYDIPSPVILDLQVTVSGSASGDGVYSLGDFTGAVFGTGGIALDFSRELVGQPTDGSPWGTASVIGKSLSTKGRFFADFNLFSNPQQPARVSTGDLYSGGTGNQGISLPPNGVGPFTLRASSGEDMAIASFAPFAVTSVPSLNIYSIIGFALMLMLIGFIRLRKA
jgi:hypothetical protein